LDRNLLNCYNIMALSLIYLGRSEAAFSPNAKAMELSPRDPYGPAFYVVGSLAHLHLGHDAEAMALARQGITIDDKYPFNYFVLAAALGNRGELVQARETWSKFKTFPTSETLDTIAKWRTRDLSRSKNPTFLAQREKYLYPGLRKAGVPEE
jgi:tetratricopeptide (TPR) repeat protein